MYTDLGNKTAFGIFNVEVFSMSRLLFALASVLLLPASERWTASQFAKYDRVKNIQRPLRVSSA